ncbi:DMT family transporter [Devosia algicola]|uniref:DMT family transporter n=1 Tax=Devosia algicola TaxID=3026418 RepID=A0ABY7YKZ9_9HYPH|nr:DMT family transporter [Devosia algicola]WDR01862.1 DMT family transporter [Devosia algicola]
MSTADEGKNRLLAHLAMLTFALLIAGSFAFGSLIAGEIAPAPLNAVRFLLGTAVMGVVAFGPAGNTLAVPQAPWRFIILGALLAVYFVTMFVALKITAPVATSAIFTLIPLLVAGFGLIIVGQRTGPVGLVSLIFAGMGSLWVIFRGDFGAMARFEIGPGEQIFFVGCLCYAINTPLLRRFSRGEPAMVLSFFSLAATTVWIGLYGLPEMLATNWGALPPIVWWVILYLAVFPTAVSFFLLQFASLHLPAAKVIAYGYLTPIFVIVLEGLMGHGWASLSVLMGALITVLGLLVLGLSHEHPKSGSARPKKRLPS